MKTVVTIVNYNSWEATRRMLASANLLNIKPDIYVLDNSSEIVSGDSFNPKDYYEGKTCLLQLGRNYGYFGALSQFLSTRKDIAFDWLFIANSDLVFTDSALFDSLEEYSKHWEKSIGVFCPAVISNKTKLDQNPFLEKKPRLYYYYKYRLLTSNYYLARAYTALSRFKAEIKMHRSALSGQGSQGKARSIFAPHGAFVGFSKDFFLKGGYIENRNFLFHEEEILGFICHRIGLKVIYDPGVSISHDEHLTTGGRYSRKKHAIRKKSLKILKEYMLLS